MANRSIFNFVQSRCSVVESVRVYLCVFSVGVTYSFLELFYIRMSHLHKLTLDLDINILTLTILWTLSQARHLTKMKIQVTKTLAKSAPVMRSWRSSTAARMFSSLGWQESPTCSRNKIELTTPETVGNKYYPSICSTLRASRWP